MSLPIEGLLRGLIGIRHPIENTRPTLRVMPDTFAAQRTAQASIRENAHKIADNVRKHGAKKFGQMWAWGYAKLPDSRIVFLQQSQNEKQIGDALEINIPASVTQPGIHIRYDLSREDINSFEMRNIDGMWVYRYWMYDRPEYGTRFPANLTLSDIVGPVETILTSVENASKTITKMKPEPTPITTV